MSSDNDEQSCLSCLEGRVGGEYEGKYHFIFIRDAYDHIGRHHTSWPLFANLRAEWLVCILQED